MRARPMREGDAEQGGGTREVCDLVTSNGEKSYCKQRLIISLAYLANGFAI